MQSKAFKEKESSGEPKKEEKVHMILCIELFFFPKRKKEGSFQITAMPLYMKGANKLFNSILTLHIIRTLVTQYKTSLVIILPCIWERGIAVFHHIYTVIKPKVNSSYFHAAIWIRN